MGEASDTPRIRPGGRTELGWLNTLIVKIIGRAAGTGPRPECVHHARPSPLAVPALARVRRWTDARRSLPRADSELVILRVAHNMGSDYEWGHHERLGRAAGLSSDEIARVRGGAAATGWSERQALLLQAADALHDRPGTRRRAVGAAAGPTFSGARADRALPADRPLRDAGDDARESAGPARGSAARRAPSPLAGRRVLITGAARGIGAATAKRLHQRGARLALAGIETDQLEAVAAECGNALAIPCDVREPRAGRRGGERRRRAPRWTRRGHRQRRGRRPAAAARRRSRGVRAHDRGQPAGGLLHAPCRRPAHFPPGRIRPGDLLARGSRPSAAARRLQRVEGRRRGARQCAADRTRIQRRARRRRVLRRARHRHDAAVASAPRPPASCR